MIPNNASFSFLFGLSAFCETPLYQCLKEDTRLTLREKAILMQYPEECVKRALEYSIINPTKATLMELLIWYCNQATIPVYKSFWQKNKFEIITSIALSIVTIAVSVFFLSKTENPQDSFLLDKADPGRVMATEIKNIYDIPDLKKLNGVEISKIEYRARPGGWASSGFLGREDSLLEVLQKDWKTVDALGTTHIELADHLKSIWDIAVKNYENSGKSENLISYNFDKLKINTMNKLDAIQLFKATIGFSCGMQGDIFYNDTKFNENEFLGWAGESWNGDLRLTNPKNNEAILVGEGVINYIRKYGFYEGGEKNLYRIDPIRLASVFTGHTYCKVANSIKQPCV